LNQAAPTISVNPAGGVATFLGTSAGAADMKFTVNGAEQLSGTTNNGNGTWSFNWTVWSLPDGTYTIGAAAVDALGTRGQPRTMQVILSRSAPGALANLAGGYNYVNVAGTRTLAAELAWDANPEGSVTGYQVLRGATSVCGSSTSLTRSCSDFSPASSGSSTYTVKTWYRDSAGAAQSISTTYAMTAPGVGTIPTLYGLGNTTGYTGSQCSGGNAIPASLGSGTVTFKVWYTNTGNKACVPGGALYAVPANTLLVSTAPSFASGTTVPTLLTYTATVATRSLATGDQLVWQLNGHGTNNFCTTTSFYFNSASHQTTISLPTLVSAGDPPLAQPAAPSGLVNVHNADGTNTLTWNVATGTPGPDFYRIYRDGQNYANRYDTAGDTGQSTLTWTDTNTGGTSHTYYVTTAASTLAESNTMAGPVSG
jgi:hypothetical protein